MEYICESCGTLLIHSNQVTLDSMKDVHNQLCSVKRQNIVIPVPQVPQRSAPTAQPSLSTTPSPSQTLNSPPAQQSTTAPASGGQTTISLTGNGTNYSKIEGPIDPEFKSTLKKSSWSQKNLGFLALVKTNSKISVHDL